jgi:hypothetical protein
MNGDLQTLSRQISKARNSPPQPRGGAPIQTMAPFLSIGATGWCWSKMRSLLIVVAKRSAFNNVASRHLTNTTPSAPANERGHFIGGAATPPRLRRGIVESD